MAAFDAERVAGEVADGVVTAEAPRWERERRLPIETLRTAAEAGLTGLVVAPERGGKGLSFTALGRVAERLAAADMAFAFSLLVHNNLMSAIARFGNDDQRDRWLPRLATMADLGAFLLTEPGAGSDAAAITTTARRDGEHWILDGDKAWVTNASHAGVLSVYAQTDSTQGARGIACFLVDATSSGVERGAAYELLGGHALGAGGFAFRGCRVPAEDMLVPPGQGFRAALAGIDLARASVAAMCAGMLGAGLKLAVAHASERSAFGAKVADFQGVQWQLADVETDLRAMRLLADDAMRCLDADEPAALAAAHAKKFATRRTLAGLATCMQAMGAEGLKTDHPLARHLGAAKIAEYVDGTTEIQNVVISRALFAKPR